MSCSASSMASMNSAIPARRIVEKTSADDKRQVNYIRQVGIVTTRSTIHASSHHCAQTRAPSALTSAKAAPARASTPSTPTKKLQALTQPGTTSLPGNKATIDAARSVAASNTSRIYKTSVSSSELNDTSPGIGVPSSAGEHGRAAMAHVEYSLSPIMDDDAYRSCCPWRNATEGGARRPAPLPLLARR